MTNLQKLIEELKQFYGSEQFYKNPLFPEFVYTEGVKYLAEQANCYWLIDYVFSNQIISSLKNQPFQVWKIKVNSDDSAKVTIEDGNKKELTFFHIGYTDFPLEEIQLWFIEDTLLLPSEY